MFREDCMDDPTRRSNGGETPKKTVRDLVATGISNEVAEAILELQGHAALSNRQYGKSEDGRRQPPSDLELD